jgi:LPS export ABC transporter protein LptC
MSGGRLRLVTRRLLAAALLVAAAGSVLWYRGLERGGDAAAPTAGVAPSADAEMVTRDFRHVEVRLDRTIWILEAKQAEVRGEQAQLTAVKITWYGEQGGDPVVITSAAGRIDFGKRTAVLTGRVRAQRADGAALETEQLTYDEGRKVLLAPADVLLTTPTSSFRGTALTANLERRWVKLSGRVEGEIRGVNAAAAGNS